VTLKVVKEFISLKSSKRTILVHHVNESRANTDDAMHCLTCRFDFNLLTYYWPAYT